MRALRYTVLWLSLLAAVSTPIRAQVVEKEWQQLWTFPHKSYVVYFIALPGPPRIGFVGSQDTIYRTTDGGTTWNPAVTDNQSFRVSDIVFKDSLTGWFTNSKASTSPVYRTTDGGRTWSPLVAPADITNAIHYNPANGWLYLSSWTASVRGALSHSTNDGDTWTIDVQPDFFNGTAFLNPDTGFVTLEGQGGYLTTNGGATWSGIAFKGAPYETWQPLADTFRSAFWAGAEAGLDHPTDSMGTVFKSTDFGNSFQVFATVPAITGTMREGSCGLLYLQACNFAPDSMKSVLRSDDGSTWLPLRDAKGKSGPYNWVDTRFFVKGTYIYALGYTPGDDSVRLWRYIEDSTKFGGGIAFTAPIVSVKRVDIVSTSCASLDTTIYVIYQNDCIPATLESATLDSTDRFVLLPRDTLPHQIKDYFPLTIGHRPQDRSSDTTRLFLHYFANGKDLYDTVMITAVVNVSTLISPVDLFADGGKSANVRAGDTVRMTLRLTDSVGELVNLDSVGIEAGFDDNVLTFAGAKAFAPWSILTESNGNGVEDLSLARATGAPLVPHSIAAEIDYVADITTASSTSYTMTSLRLNDAEFNGCAGPASLPLSPTVSVYACGDTLFRAMMTGQPVIQLLGVEVAGREAKLGIQSARAGEADIDIYDLLGAKVNASRVSLRGGGVQWFNVDISYLPSGVYFIRLAMGGAALSARIVVER